MTGGLATGRMDLPADDVDPYPALMLGLTAAGVLAVFAALLGL